MYHKPTLERFGSFRELTRVGFTGASDGWFVKGTPSSPGVTGNDICQVDCSPSVFPTAS